MARIVFRNFSSAERCAAGTVARYSSIVSGFRFMVGPMAQPSISDHQANERTFLAWLRTAIALMGFGFVVAKFGLFLRIAERAPTEHRGFTSALIGISLVSLGGLMAATSAFRYQLLQRKIDAGTYEPGRWPIWIAGGSLAVLAALLVAYLDGSAR
jgi:putative membrane protein